MTRVYDASYEAYLEASQAPTHRAPRPAAAPRPNRYPGRCAGCRQRVEEQAGVLAGSKAAGWTVRHLPGQCPAVEEQPAAAPQPQVPEGRYATASRTGRNALAFWLVEHGTGRWDGRIFVRRVIGGRPPQRIRRDEQAAALAAIAAAGDVAARELYAREMEECWKCGTHLTDDISREALIGPDCCKNVHGVTQRQYLASKPAA